MHAQYDASLQASAKLFKALGNPYRLRIVYLLLNGEKNVSELNSEVKVSQPALSQHLAKLKRDGVLVSRRTQRQIYYSIKHEEIVRVLRVGEEAVRAQRSPEMAMVAKAA